MNTILISTLAAVGGFAVGFLVRLTEKEDAPVAAPPTRERPVGAQPTSMPGFGPAGAMLGLAEQSATLRPAEWPAFFESHLDHPANSRLAARLWAEEDPAGFWEWLREGRDRLRLEQFGDDLLATWAAAHPDAAMAAAAQITDKTLADRLRRTVVDTALDADLEKGLELAARSGDFNRFGWGVREWMKKDPAAAVRGLAGLPVVTDYRHFLAKAVPIWGESDPLAAIDWLKDNPPLPNEPWGDDWMTDGFTAAAIIEPEAALEAAKLIPDPRHRDLALAGVVAGGQLDPESQRAVLAEIRLPALARLGSDLIESRDHQNPADLALSAELLEQLPSNRNNLGGVSSLASKWGEIDPARGWQWATSLPDPAMRRKALASLISSQDPDGVVPLISNLPLRDLSPDLLRSAHNRIPHSERDSWIRQLPADRAGWAASLTE